MGRVQDTARCPDDTAATGRTFRFPHAKIFANDTRRRRAGAIQGMNMSTKKRKTETAHIESDADAKAGDASCAAPCSWLDQAESFAHREPAKAVACAFSAGLLLHLLPTRASTAVVFTLARPV